MSHSRIRLLKIVICAGGVVLTSTAHAEDPTAATTVATSAPIAQTAPEATPIDPTKLTMPKLDFTATPQDELDFEKYFYFHRDVTSFAEAYDDIKECDALASGVNFYAGNSSGAAAASAQYGVLAGGIGSAIGSAIADAIFGAAQRRKTYRMSMRTCMGFKEYHRYGLNKDLWSEFNFTEGNGRKKEIVREEAQQLQALVASGPKPSTKELQP